MINMKCRSLVCALVTFASLGGACWSTEGLGLGPYSPCVEASDCDPRDQPVCLQETSEEEDGAPESLFCSTPCVDGDPRGCPLADAYPGLTPTCLEPLAGEGTYCALATVDSCPDDEGMTEIVVNGVRVCVFDDPVNRR